MEITNTPENQLFNFSYEFLRQIVSCLYRDIKKHWEGGAMTNGKSMFG